MFSSMKKDHEPTAHRMAVLTGRTFAVVAIAVKLIMILKDSQFSAVSEEKIVQRVVVFHALIIVDLYHHLSKIIITQKDYSRLINNRL